MLEVLDYASQYLAQPLPRPELKRSITGRSVPLHVLDEKVGYVAGVRGRRDQTDNILSKIDSHLKEQAGPKRKEPYELDGSKVAYHTDRIEAWLRGERIAPISVDWALTRRCNYECGYCYAELQNNQEHEMKPEHIRRTLDDFAEIGVRGSSFISDGESTVHHYFYDAVRHGKQNGLDMGLATNGYLLKEEKLAQLLADLTYIRFNFSAGTAERYAEIMGGRASEEKKRLYVTKFWPKVLDTIKQSTEIKERDNLDVTIGMQMVLMPQDLDQAVPLAKLGVDLGVDYVVIKHCTDDEFRTLGIDYRKYLEEQFISELKRAESLSNNKTFVKAKWSKILSGGNRHYHQCFGPPFIIQFSGSGLVAPCGGLFNDRYNEEYHIGNLTEKSFKEIWESDKYWEVMDRIRSKHFDPRTDCATLCIQHNTNEVLFDLVHGSLTLNDLKEAAAKAPAPAHVNFI